MIHHHVRGIVLAGAVLLSCGGRTDMGLIPTAAEAASAPVIPARLNISANAMIAYGDAEFTCARRKYGHCQSLFLTAKGKHRAGLITGTPQNLPGPCVDCKGGWGATALRAAYNLPAHGGAGRTVAIVALGHYANLESDLAFYRAHYGLSPCSVAGGCLRIVDGDGGSNYPPTIPDGQREEVIDATMVSANCQDCNILVVESDLNANVGNDLQMQATNWLNNVAHAVQTAVALHANAVSISFATAESALYYPPDSAKAFNIPGVVITASSGDSGYTTQVGGGAVPALFPTVVAVGVTTLARPVYAGFRPPPPVVEWAWSGSGSACSNGNFPVPLYQGPVFSACRSINGTTLTRAIPDVSYAANPYYGVWIYYSNSNTPGWQLAGGTSVGAPAIAAISQLTGASTTLSRLYSRFRAGGAFRDITSGTNSARGCNPAILCNAAPGFDGPTGMGSPYGILGFTP